MSNPIQSSLRQQNLSCAETEPEQSSRTARRCGKTHGTLEQKQNRLYYGTETFCTRNSLSFYPHERTVTPRYLTTQYNGLCHVTLYHTYPHRSNHQAFKNLLRRQETGDSSHTNPPLACNTQQYAAQRTRNTEHKYAPRCDH
jgi:hypothetical protein